MRQGPNGRRPRRHNGGSNGSSVQPQSNGGNNNYRHRSASSLRQQNFDSNGPDVRVRGNAWQVYEKYQALARDATSNGDPVLAENLLQHAEHYYRIIEAINEATEQEQRQRPSPYTAQQPEIPSNYYGNTGGVVPPGAPVVDGNNNNGQSQPMAQAEVQVRTPPKPAFFTPEEIDEVRGAEPLVAQR